MAMQPNDRQKAKHSFKTAPRSQPAMVRRSNKCVMPDHAPRHIVTAMHQDTDRNRYYGRNDINWWY